jgi:type II secretory pathway pseudopilin PulG
VRAPQHRGWPRSLGKAGAAARHGRHGRGAVLLEVVLALTVFFIGAAIITGGLISSARALNNARQSAQAADLAISKLSEVQMGMVEPTDQGPTAYEDDDKLEGWTWQIVATPIQDETGLATLASVEITVRHDESATQARLVELMPVEADVLSEPPGEMPAEQEQPW